MNKNNADRPKAKGYEMRYRILGAFLVLYLFVIYGKVLHTMFVDGDRWRAIGETLHKNETEQLPPIRGRILAADGRILAITAPYYRIYVDFQSDPIVNLKAKDEKERRDSMMRILDTMAYYVTKKFSLPNRPLDAKKLKARWLKGYENKSRYVSLIGYDISYLELQELYNMPPFGMHEQSQIIEKGKKGSKKYKQIVKRKKVYGPMRRSIIKEEKAKRMNPFGSLASRTIGNVYGATEQGGVSSGKYGLELYYDSLLKGDPGLANKIYAAGRRLGNTLIEPTNGADVYSTLDMDMQSIVEEELRNKLIETNAESGSVILMEVKTGKIKAVSNLRQQGEGRYTEAMNYAMADMSEPGSTFKVPSMIVALDEGIVRPEDIVDVGNGVMMIGGRRITDHNAHRGGYGKITAAQCIWYSSNLGVAKIIMGHYSNKPDAFVEALRRTGIADSLGLEVPGAGTAKVPKSNEMPYWSASTLATMTYGYATKVPPINTLALYNALANDGKMMRPYMVSKVVKEGKTLLQKEPEVIRDSVCKHNTLMAVRQMLSDVVKKGTGRPANSKIVNISGKTGTSKLWDNASRSYGGGHQLTFCGYFPSEDPQYSCIVVVRKPRGVPPSGGGISGVVLKNIAEKLYAMKEPYTLEQVSADFVPALIPQVQGGSQEQIKSVLRKLNIPIVGLETSSEKDANWARAYVQDQQIRLEKMAKESRGIVPNVVGLSASDATYLLQHMGLRVKAEGFGRVVAQSIPAKSSYKKGQSISISLAM